MFALCFYDGVEPMGGIHSQNVRPRPQRGSLQMVVGSPGEGLSRPFEPLGLKSD